MQCNLPSRGDAGNVARLLRILLQVTAEPAQERAPGGCRWPGRRTGLFQPLQPTSGFCSVPQMLDMELQNLVFVLPVSGLLWSNLAFLVSHSSVLEWECLLYATVSQKYETYIQNHIRAHRLMFALGDFELWSNDRTVMTMWTLDGGLNAFCIVRWS